MQAQPWPHFSPTPETLPLLLNTLQEKGFKLLVFLSARRAFPKEEIPFHRIRNAVTRGAWG